MTQLDERRYLKCPYHTAREYLASAITTAIAHETPRVVRLRVSLADVEIEKDVQATFSPQTDPRHFDQPWTVHWEPAGGGPFPIFDGTIAVRSAEDYDSCILELQGAYDPPLGGVGKIFDAAIGSRVAKATAQNLLATIGERMETQHAREEASKSS